MIEKMELTETQHEQQSIKVHWRNTLLTAQVGD